MHINNPGNVPRPVFVNQDVLELRLMYSTWTGALWLEPRETPIHTSGYSCSGATTISNSLTGLGSGKSKCCDREGGRGKCPDSRFNLEALLVYWLCPQLLISLGFTLISMNLCIGSYHCSSTTLDSRAQHKNTQPRCRFSAAGEETESKNMQA